MNLQDIQSALRNSGLDGWLFFDHHGRDPIAYRVLGLPLASPTRRWYYFIPAEGTPTRIVHRIEPGVLDSLEGRRVAYASWVSQREALSSTLRGVATDSPRIAMQYSPNCAVPYVAMVDAGTVELVRSLGCEVVTSADLVQQFESTWSAAQFDQHRRAGERVDAIRSAAFRKIGDDLAAGRTPTEYSVQQFILASFERDGLFTDHGPIVAVDANASNPHYEPSAESSAPIRRDQLVLIDLWAKLREPHAVFYDVTWTGYTGRAIPERHAQVFSIAAAARDAAVAFVRSRVSANQPLCGFEVDDACRNVIAQAGLGEYFFHRTGHSIGEDVHGTGANMDNLETHDERLVIANTCFSVEPGIYLPEFGVRTEVNVFVSATDAVIAGEVQREMICVGS